MNRLDTVKLLQRIKGAYQRFSLPRDTSEFQEMVTVWENGLKGCITEDIFEALQKHIGNNDEIPTIKSLKLLTKTYYQRERKEVSRPKTELEDLMDRLGVDYVNERIRNLAKANGILVSGKMPFFFQLMGNKTWVGKWKNLLVELRAEVNSKGKKKIEPVSFKEQLDSLNI